jgi:hypothetical protein
MIGRNRERNRDSEKDIREKDRKREERERDGAIKRVCKRERETKK